VQVTPEALQHICEYVSYHSVQGRSDKVRPRGARARTHAARAGPQSMRTGSAPPRSAAAPTPHASTPGLQERRAYDQKFMLLGTRELCSLTSAADALEMRVIIDLTSRALARQIEGERGLGRGQYPGLPAEQRRQQQRQRQPQRRHALTVPSPAGLRPRLAARAAPNDGGGGGPPPAGKSPEQIRTIFNLPDDLTEEEKLEPLRNAGNDPRVGAGVHAVWAAAATRACRAGPAARVTDQNAHPMHLMRRA